MSKKAVIFDMDGVIIDSEPLWQDAQMASLASYGIAVTRADCEQLTMGKRVDEIARIWCQSYALSVSAAELEQRILTKLCQLIARVGQAMPGVVQTLDYVKRLNLKIALATSSNHVVIKAVFDQLKLWDKFDLVCSAEDEKQGKPAPDVYLSAAKKLNLSPQACLVIEDSVTGLTASKAANMTTFLVSPHCEAKTFASADAKFANMIELLTFLTENEPLDVLKTFSDKARLATS